MESVDNPFVEVIQNTETGERYISDVRDIDVGFGNYLFKLLDGLRESDAAKYPSFHKYTNREQHKKLIISSETEPRRFVRQVRQRYFDKDGKNSSDNKNALPLVYFHRVLGFDQSISGEENMQKDVGAVSADGVTMCAAVDSLPVTITYMVYIIAWDTATLDKLVAGLTASLISSSRTFNYETSILGVSQEVSATLTPANSVSWGDISPSNTEDRLLVFQCSLEVKASYYQARCVTTARLRYTLARPTPMYQTGLDHV